MKKIFFSIKWFSAFVKRLMRKKSFLLTLLLIPLLTYVLTMASKEESGIMNIAITSRDSESTSYKNILSQITDDEKSSLLFTQYPTPYEAKEAVRNGKAECAWIFEDDFENRCKRYASGDKSATLCEVVVKEDTSFTKLAREKLYSILYKEISFDIFSQFMVERDIQNENLSNETYKDVFDNVKNEMNGNLINVTFFGNEEKSTLETNYLTSPLKGLLAVAMLICCYSAMMFSLEDEREGKYACFPLAKRLSIHFLFVFSAGVIVSLAVFISLLLSNNTENVAYDILMLALYTCICVFFCILVGILCRTSSRMCVLLPLLIVCVVCLCPIFLSTNGFFAVKILLPTYHYMQTLLDISNIVGALVYTAFLLFADIVLYKAINRA